MQMSRKCEFCGMDWNEQDQLSVDCPNCGKPNPAFVIHDDFCPQNVSADAVCLCQILGAVRHDERRLRAEKIRGVREQLAEMYGRYEETAGHHLAIGQIRGLYQAEQLIKAPWLRRRKR
jgi:predicted  nucleic acid-binding Zn-ribbon protein